MLHSLKQKLKVFVNAIKRAKLNHTSPHQSPINSRPATNSTRYNIPSGLWPTDNNVGFFLERLCAGECGIDDVLSRTFSCNSAGLNFDSKETNFESLVIFARRENARYGGRTLCEDNERIHHLRSCLSRFIEKFERLSKNSDDVGQMVYYYEQADRIRKILIQSLEAPELVKLDSIYSIVVENWEELKGWSFTYRLLANLVKLNPLWKTTYDTCIELASILKEMDDEWAISRGQKVS